MLSEKKRQHLFFIEIPENNAKNSARQNVNYCVTNFLYHSARNQKSDVADEKQYKPDCSRQECQMAGGAFPLSGKFRGERRVAVIDPDHQRDKRRHQVAALRLVVAEIRVVHVHEQRDPGRRGAASQRGEAAAFCGASAGSWQETETAGIRTPSAHRTAGKAPSEDGRSCRRTSR